MAKKTSGGRGGIVLTDKEKIQLIRTGKAPANKKPKKK